MAKTPITEAKTITAEVVLELSTYHNAKDLRSLQSKLTSTARELHGFSNSITLRGRICGFHADSDTHSTHIRTVI
ncbi:hypothetical protein ACW9I5_32360, partial [Pseudomonas azotoformans]